MKSAITATLALVHAITCCAAAEEKQSAQRFTGEVKLPASYPYLLALPKGYAAETAKAWPLLVFLHGAGERGDHLDQLKQHGPPKLIESGREFPAIVVSPQCPNGQIWDHHAIKALVEDLKSKHRVDATRVYLTGLSMGGFATWETGIEYPETFAALVPICGGAGVRFLLADRIKDTPIWIFHGGKDSVVSPDYSKRMHDVLKRIGGKVQLTLYPEAGHDSWTAAYNDEELWAWLFAQKRG